MHKTKLTLAQHAQFGAELRMMQERIAEITSAMSDADARSTGAFLAVKRTESDLLWLRDTLETLMRREHEGFENMDRVYFGACVVKTATES